MARKILIAPSSNHSKKRNAKTLSRDDLISAIVSKIFVAAIGSIFVFVGSAMLFRLFVSGIAVLLLAGCAAVFFSLFIFTRDNKPFAEKTEYKHKEYDLYDPNDGMNPRNYSNPASPYYINTNTNERNDFHTR